MKTTMKKKRNNIQAEQNNNILQNLIDYTFVRIFNKYLRKKSHSPKLTAKIWIGLFLYLNLSAILFPIGINPTETNACIIGTITLLLSLIYFSEPRVKLIKECWDNIMTPNQKSRYGWFSFYYILFSVILWIVSFFYSAPQYR